MRVYDTCLCPAFVYDGIYHLFYLRRGYRM